MSRILLFIALLLCVSCTPALGLECIDCMDGMAMPQCPYPELCKDQDSNSTSSSSCMMQMTFGVSETTCLFFSEWNINNGGQWAGAFFTILALAMLREGLSVYRLHQHLTTKQEDNLRRLKRLLTLRAASKENSPERTGLSSPQSGDIPLGSKPLLTAATVHSSPHDHQLQLNMAEVRVRARLLSLPPPSSDFSLHMVDSLYYLASLILGYLLMLVIMTYNLYLCIMVVGSCFLCHFTWNYVYHTKWKKTYLSEVRCVVAAYRAEHGVVQSAVQDPTGVIIDGAGVRPTSGDHCCDDINFDDV